jgi:predicted MPP superfamily phosphohydrolase
MRIGMWRYFVKNIHDDDIRSERFSWEQDKRRIWMINRSLLENNTHKRKRYGGRTKSHWPLFVRLARVFALILKIFRVYERGYSNAKNIVVKRITASYNDLPESFDSYKILHLTDLHLDSIADVENLICEKLLDLEYDLCVMTGDYRERIDGGFKKVLKAMKKITGTIKASDGILATLGNHDSYLMIEHFEEMGIKILANETSFIHRKKDKIAVTGVDDPHYYYTDQAVSSIEQEVEGFKILLAHSPELYDLAAHNDYNLYLCGHTHGGQICLPGGIPVFTHVYSGRRFCRGLWSYSNMKGYTSQGCGTSAIPVRYNSQSEIALITLKKM